MYFIFRKKFRVSDIVFYRKFLCTSVNSICTSRNDFCCIFRNIFFKVSDCKRPLTDNRNFHKQSTPSFYEPIMGSLLHYSTRRTYNKPVIGSFEVQFYERKTKTFVTTH